MRHTGICLSLKDFLVGLRGRRSPLGQALFPMAGLAHKSEHLLLGEQQVLPLQLAPHLTHILGGGSRAFRRILFNCTFWIFNFAGLFS